MPEVLSTYDKRTLLFLLTHHGWHTSSEVATAVYEPADRQQFVSNDNTTRSRLHRLCNSGLVLTKEGSRPKQYAINQGRVRLGHGEIDFLNTEGVLSIDLGDNYIAITDMKGALVMEPIEKIW